MSQESIYITNSCIISGNTVYKNGVPVFVNQAAGLGGFLQSAYLQVGTNYPKFYKMDNLSKLGWLATEVLVKDSLEGDKYLPEEIGVVLSNNSSSPGH